MADFQIGFLVYQIKGLQCLMSNKIIRLTISRGQLLILLLTIIQDETPPIFYPLNNYRCNISSRKAQIYEILDLRSSDSNCPPKQFS